jgi:putative DNA primase/helicase
MTDRVFWNGGDCPACKQLSRMINGAVESRVKAALEREHAIPSFADLQEQLMYYGQRPDAILQLCERLESVHHFAAMEDNGDLYVYDESEGIYVKEGRLVIERELQKHCPRISNDSVNAIIEKIRMRKPAKREQFDSDPEWFHVGNGWVNVRTRKFAKHSPKRYSLSKVPHRYDPKAKNPRQREFFEQVLEPEDLPVVQKFYGYMLRPDNRYKKAFAGIGPKDTGKSKFAGLVEHFAGAKSHVSLHDMASYNHNVAEITKSIVNTTSELPKYRLKDVSLFNSITGGDERTFREIYGRPFNARVRAKYLLVANELPDFDGMDQTFIDRWIILRFNNVFGLGEADERIMDKLTTPEEMSGLLNYALDGLQMLLKDGYFKNEGYEQVKEKWNQIGSKLTDYPDQHLEFEAGAYTVAKDLFSHYVEHTDGALSEVGFGKELKKHDVKHLQKRVGGRIRWVYDGVRLKTGVTGVLGNFPTFSTPDTSPEKEFQKLPVTPVTLSTQPTENAQNNPEVASDKASKNSPDGMPEQVDDPYTSCPYCPALRKTAEQLASHCKAAHSSRNGYSEKS